MYTFEYYFYPDRKKHSLLDYYDKYLTYFLSSLSRNGQIIDQHWNVVEDGEAIKFICMAIDEDSLNPKYYNDYCKETLSRLNKASCNSPKYVLVGETVGASSCCSCEESSFYILFTTSSADYPPISCGDCNLPVPLYKFPNFEGEKEYYPISQWENVYQACDILFMTTYIGEIYGYKQISNFKSKLTESGINICKEMSRLTSKPFYYFLHKWYKPQKDFCPQCGQYWKLSSKLHNLYTHKCDKCYLISANP